MNNKESQLYDAFVEYLIKKAQSGTVDVKELALIKDFIAEKNIGANPQTHKGTAKLLALPFEESEDEVQPIRKQTK